MIFSLRNEHYDFKLIFHFLFMVNCHYEFHYDLIMN
jgi:hypothetical protein